MCRKAVEVQELWVGQRGDLYVAQNETIIEHVDLGTNACIKNYCDPWLEKTTVTRLPRQDQLQEILDNKYSKFTYPIFAITSSFDVFAREYKGFEFIKSMEQLWLAFVMKEKFNKTWNGKDWSKDES